MNKIPDWAIYCIIAGITIVIVLPFQDYLTDRFSPQRNYQRGLQAGMENAEYYCKSFDTDYIGSLGYIQKHDPELYRQLMSNEE